jgi:hypothetical protein
MAISPGRDSPDGRIGQYSGLDRWAKLIKPRDEKEEPSRRKARRESTYLPKYLGFSTSLLGSSTITSGAYLR